mgnify:CR=1 FL=1
MSNLEKLLLALTIVQVPFLYLIMEGKIFNYTIM